MAGVFTRKAAWAASSLLGAFVVAGATAAAPVPASPPRLARNGQAIQLMVDGRPYLMLAGELGNSSASSVQDMAPKWARLKAIGLNTVLTPVYWEQIETQPGQFDFSGLDGLIQGARGERLHLVLLWLGAWKNSQSSYVPAWIKRDQARYPRIRRADGEAEEVLSPLAPATLEADRRAFVALMAHLKTADPQHTVLMVQVENEVGMIPEARDHSAPAEVAFDGPVSGRLLAYLAAHRESLTPEVRGAWESHGGRASGTWREVFGEGALTDEIFSAWNFAAYIQHLAEAGKAADPLPMYVNAALIRPGRTPGRYPSGGPLPHLIDVWKAGAPALDMLSPDLYFPNFGPWTRPYDRPDNPLFVPEAENAGSQRAPANALFAFGALKAMGFSPFAIDGVGVERLRDLQGLYGVLAEIGPELSAAQARGDVIGFESPASYDGVPIYEPQVFEMGDVEIEVSFPAAGGTSAAAPVAAPGAPGDTAASAQGGATAKPVYGGLVIRRGPRDFLVAGQGVVVAFRRPSASDHAKLGIDSLTEGHFADGAWVAERRLNGDQSNQGRYLRFAPDAVGLQRVTLYDYK